MMIHAMLNDERFYTIIMAGLISSDNDPETLEARLIACRKLIDDAEKIKHIHRNTSSPVVERINEMITKLNTYIEIIERDMKLYNKEETTIP